MKPRPRGRLFELASAPSSAPSTPPSDSQSFGSNVQAPLQPPSTDGATTPSRTRSILNLTSSTLFGIYQPTGYATDRDEPSTPWGTGAETPTMGVSRDGSFDFTRDRGVPDTVVQKAANGHTKLMRRRSTAHRPPRRGLKGYLLPMVGRTLALSGVGMLYGLLISHLHDRREIAPVKVEGLDQQGWPYFTFWSIAGVLLGEAMPKVDKLWAPQDDDGDVEEHGDSVTGRGHGSGDWMDVVRSISAFVGIAFAIRKLPWESTLQLSLTLALANPAVWYLIDRSPAGFVLSSLVAISGTAVLLGINPALLPSPTPSQVLRGHLVFGVFSHESIGVASWIASVLFVSSVCFGNIGRRLAAP
ncbi:hypothetical protein M433DRAFT_71096 [Acidomyces richmondensis BFW]|nr:MAG: hypothetical protein FE78DRAFT_138388 [Acidomyces sp. 'richmondensis']KYG43690.1 hypothetical protein M433DRAFT_71096 [Acidomyces richmondensis BFW]